MSDAILAVAAQTSGVPGGPAPAAATDPATLAAPAGESTQQSTGQKPAWMAQLPKDLLEDPELSQHDKLEKLARSWKDQGGKLKELDKRLSETKAIPTKESKPEEWNAFWAALGRPEKADGYQFDRSGEFEQLPTVPGLDEFTAELYHRHNLPKDVAESIWKEQSKKTVELLAQIKAENEAKKTTALKELEKRWGREYDQRRNDFEKAFGQFFGEKTAKEFLGSPWANDPDFIEKLAGLRKYMVNSPIIDGGAAGGANPWLDASANLTEQGRILRENPQLARNLAQAAGKKTNF